MSELAYPVGHPKHPDFKGVATETHTTHGFDFADEHPARGGAGQPVPLEPGTEKTPREGFRHLFGLDLSTLAKAETQFAKLNANEKEQRLEWNEKGFPPEILEGE
ncbi:MAG: hypothetical protein DMG78_14900 [Acidobacteria bacterium]|nr:MAG: hypothetical protein DMG78_14900 [Acidobacteriota bacterium]